MEVKRGSWVLLPSATATGPDNVFHDIGRRRAGPELRLASRGTATTEVAGGTWVITPVVTGLVATNYSFTPVNNNLVITKSVLTVTPQTKTKTYDGLALAWACAAHLADKAQSLTLFATHYFELTGLPGLYQGVGNVHLSAREHAGDIVFLYQVKQGPASQSYGIQVAKLAGVPASVLSIARKRLASLERGNNNPHQSDLFSPTSHQDSLVDSYLEDPMDDLGNTVSDEDMATLEQLKEADIDDLTPRQALTLLYELKNGLSNS